MKTRVLAGGGDAFRTPAVAAVRAMPRAGTHRFHFDPRLATQITGGMVANQGFEPRTCGL